MTKREEVIAAMERKLAHLRKVATLSAAETVSKEVWLDVEEVLEIWETR